uniref:Integrator complex subunit 5 n=1 Tax=Timema monikensis TaxID=170555 RepID=A0A7R9E621_9NEOP|nr:unnamed protein product [Timema monikensis]
MAGTSVIKNMPSHDLLSELRTFVSGATRSMKTNPLEFARTALSLLKTLPAARDAVLEYFCTLFDSAVDKYITDVQMMVSDSTQPGSVSYEEATITEIHNVLCSFVSLNPEAWAPIISTWSLELLGELSSRYTGMARAPMAAGLNESLQLWMSCRATRTLIDITTQCFSCLMHSDTDSCINALLDTSVAHSPNFDWVVAHVGGCFPHTVITKVLSCGLKDFSQHASAEQGAKSPKLISVVGILGHLAGSHFVDIRTALLELFKWSMEPGDVEEADQRKATVPFLFQLASVSSTLLRALTTGVLQTLDVTMLAQLGTQAPGWCEYFGSAQALEGNLFNKYTELRLQLFFPSKLFCLRLIGQPTGLAHSLSRQLFVSGSGQPISGKGKHFIFRQNMDTCLILQGKRFVSLLTVVECSVSTSAAVEAAVYL